MSSTGIQQLPIRDFATSAVKEVSLAQTCLFAVYLALLCTLRGISRALFRIYHVPNLLLNELATPISLPSSSISDGIATSRIDKNTSYDFSY